VEHKTMFSHKIRTSEKGNFVAVATVYFIIYSRLT